MKYYYIIYIVLLIILCNLTFGQGTEWKTQLSKSKQVVVNSNIYSVKNEQGDNMQIIEYNATCEAAVTLDQCLELMRNVPRHTEFLQDTKVSKIVSTLSDTEWLVYYYFTYPWPLPGSDCITRMKWEFSEDGQSFSIVGEADPEQYPDQGVRRMDLNDIRYHFNALENGKVEIRMDSRFSPMFSAPKWMVNGWFPEGPAGTLERIIKLAGSLGDN